MVRSLGPLPVGVGVGAPTMREVQPSTESVPTERQGTHLRLVEAARRSPFWSSIVSRWTSKFKAELRIWKRQRLPSVPSDADEWLLGFGSSVPSPGSCPKGGSGSNRHSGALVPQPWVLVRVHPSKVFRK